MDISPEWKQRVLRLLPDLQEGVSLHFTSPVDPNYNCLSWALGCNTLMFEKGKGSFWEWPHISDDTADGWAQLCQVHGFMPIDNSDFVPGIEKIAILEKMDDGEVSLHATRQDKNGNWKSKLGAWGPDIDHVGLEALAPVYGRVVKLLERERPDWR
jgi:hypothetical protein